MSEAAAFRPGWQGDYCREYALAALDGQSSYRSRDAPIVSGIGGERRASRAHREIARQVSTFSSLLVGLRVSNCL